MRRTKAQRNRACLLPAFVAGLVSCLSTTAAPRDPTPPIAAQPADWFEDVTARAGIDFVHRFCHERIANILLSNGAGGAVFDFDHDGWMDVYLVNWSALPGVTDPQVACPPGGNRLFRNCGDGTFQDVTRRAGLAGSEFGSAAVSGDFDNDGLTDLYVVNIGRSRLYRNRGDGTFQDVTDAAGVGHTGTGIAATFFDADNDGHLDLFLANYLTYRPQAQSEQNPGAYPGPLAYVGEANVFYHNKGDGSFEDLTKAAGLSTSANRAMSVAAFDADGDGDVDLYICNDDTPNQLWINDGQGHFHDRAVEAGVAFNSIGEAPGSMNAAVGDATGDGRPDLFVTRFGYGSFYVQRDEHLYEDRLYRSGLGLLTRKYVGWGGAFLDFDNDADLDLVVANGSAFVLEGTGALLLENERTGTFTDASARGGGCFRARVNGRGNAVLDFDNDGRLDVLLTALADRPFLLRNRGASSHHWLKLNLQGSRSNRSGYGARVRLMSDGLTLVAQAWCPTGFLCQGDPRVHFGLGSRSRIDALEVLWPSGTRQVLKDIPADQILEVHEPP
ncbi:MAG: CRTAC1 family protein [Verrucomicrobiota bacterium]